MRKKILIITGVLILIGFIFGFGYWQITLNKKISNIQKAVLTSLEEKLEFCEIIKSDIIKENGKFWLICNNRPFYAEYLNGELKYELSGWSFLKTGPVVWNDLENCEFYDSEKIDNDYNLTFYCPKDLPDLNQSKAKTYSFNFNTLKMEKVEEKNFLNVVNNDIKSIYPFLSECEIKSFSLESYEIPVLFLNYSCEDGEWFVLSRALLSLQPPILMNQGLSYEERARISFEKAFNCEIKDISSMGSSVTINSTCQDREFSIIYRFSDIPFVSFRVKCEEPCLEFGKYFIFPHLKDGGKATLIKKLENVYPGTYYKVGDEIIVLEAQQNYITAFWKAWGKIYEYE